MDNANALILDNITVNKSEIECSDLEMRGQGCNVFGCKNRQPPYKKINPVERSDSEGEDDEESMVKRLFQRSFHRWFMIYSFINFIIL